MKTCPDDSDFIFDRISFRLAGNEYNHKILDEFAFSREPIQFFGWILVYSIGDTRSSKFIQIMILGWLLIFLRHGQISVPVAVAILEECCIASADTQWLFYSGERIVARVPLVYKSLWCRHLNKTKTILHATCKDYETMLHKFSMLLLSLLTFSAYINENYKH